MTIVTKDTAPVYPEHCDVLDTWCYGINTPRCSPIIYAALKTFKEIASEFWSNKKPKEKIFIINVLVEKIKEETEPEKTKCKTDNVFI